MRYAIALLLPLLAGLAGCADGQARPGVDAGRALPAALDFSMKSWGRPVAEWHVDADGSGWYRESEQTVGGGYGDYRLVTHRLAIGAGGYRALVNLLRPAESYLGRSLPCERRMTDQPYGIVGWRFDGRPGELRYDLGCAAGDTKPVYEAILSAADHVRTLARDTPVVETTLVGTTARPQE